MHPLPPTSAPDTWPGLWPKVVPVTTGGARLPCPYLIDEVQPGTGGAPAALDKSPPTELLGALSGEGEALGDLVCVETRLGLKQRFSV